MHFEAWLYPFREVALLAHDPRCKTPDVLSEMDIRCDVVASELEALPAERLILMNDSGCQIVIPIYRSELMRDQEISLASIRKHLSGYGICFVAPESMDVGAIIQRGESVERFSDDYFSGIEGYNRLLKSSVFYERFKAVDYILIAQLDCLIFSGELDPWRARGYDYLASPWFRDFAKDHRPGLWRVGNGGLSLRRVKSYLRVLRQQVVNGSIYPRWGHCAWRPPLESWEAGLYTKISALYALSPFAMLHSVERELQRFPYNEDVFWSIEAPKFDSSFMVASAKEALPFAFEVSPRWSLKKTGGQLPFGCHAWERYDRPFWEEVLSDPKNSI